MSTVPREAIPPKSSVCPRQSCLGQYVSSSSDNHRFYSTCVFAAFESGGLTISCTVLYPEQFDALRRTYDCERSLVESLARCVKWDASGGKSGSAFLKTLGQFQSFGHPLCITYLPMENEMIASLPRKCHERSCSLWKHLHRHILIICRLQSLQGYVFHTSDIMLTHMHHNSAPPYLRRSSDASKSPSRKHKRTKAPASLNLRK